MSTQPDSRNSAQRQPALPVFVRAQRMRLALMLGATLWSCSMCLVIGCSSTHDGSHGSGVRAEPTSNVSEVVTTPIELPPGQLTALLAWTPSEGAVESYLVFSALNGETSYAFAVAVTAPEVLLNGSPGDALRIVVVAQSVDGTFSAASEPSPLIHFAAKGVEVEPTAALAAVAAPFSAANAIPSPVEDAAAKAVTDAIHVPWVEDASILDASTTDSRDQAGERQLVDRSLRDFLLRTNARFPYRERSLDLDRWIQAFVDVQVGAGVSLTGAGQLGGDPRLDLVWRDPSGQLFVSDGEQLTDTEDVPATFVESIRLGPTERFAGMADFDGDGIGDWAVEETTTSEVSITNGESRTIQPGHTSAEDPSLRLVGLGDFDGDGRPEMLWQQADQSLRLGGPDRESTAIEWRPSSDPVDRAGDPREFLAVADLNGDGRDDLLFRGTDERLHLALSIPDATGFQFQWTPGPDRSSDGLELFATLDLDGDGAAEIAWWGGETLSIWNLHDDHDDL